MEEQVEMMGRAFVDHYYNLFDHDRNALVSLYQPESVLTMEGQKIRGADDISAKLSQSHFDQCRIIIDTVDSQASVFGGGIIVLFSGSIQLHGEEHAFRFSQMSHLIPTEQGSFIVHTEIFRLNYG